MKLSLLNGQPAELALSNRGLAYGDGLFETIYVDKQGPQFLLEHLNRLERGASVLKLAWSSTDKESLAKLILSTSVDVNSPHVLKVMLLRQSAGRGYGYREATQSTDLIVLLDNYVKPQWSTDGATVVVSNIDISFNKSFAGLKHLNRLDSVLSRQFAIENSADESLMLDNQSHVIEGSMSNVFFKINDQWLTPNIDTAGVSGIIRNLVLQHDKNIQQGIIHRDQLSQVSAAFLTNSLIGIVPIKTLDGRVLEDADFIPKFRNEIFHP